MSVKSYLIDDRDDQTQRYVDLPQAPCVGDTIVFRDPSKKTLWVVRVTKANLPDGCEVERINGQADHLFDVDV